MISDFLLNISLPTVLYTSGTSDKEIRYLSYPYCILFYAFRIRSKSRYPIL